MGESIADLNAMEYVNEYGFLPTSDENRFSVGRTPRAASSARFATTA